MTEPKLYCGHGSEHKCAVQIVAETHVVLTERDLDALPLEGAAWGHAPGLCEPDLVATRQARLTRTD